MVYKMGMKTRKSTAKLKKLMVTPRKAKPNTITIFILLKLIANPKTVTLKKPKQ